MDMKVRPPMSAVRTALLAFILPTLSGCFLFPKEEEKLAPPLMEPPQITYETYTAERRTIVDDFTVSGIFEYTQQQNLSFRSRGGYLLGVYVRSGDRVKAGQRLAELDTDQLRFQFALQEIALQKARLRAEQAQLMGKNRIEQQLAALDVTEAELTLQNSQAELAKARLVAPADGVVVYLANLGEGDSVDAYQTILRLADPRVIDLAYTGERQSSFVFGASVEVTYEGRKYAGSVIQTTEAPSESDPARENVVIRVKGMPSLVQAGDSASIRVILQRRDNAIVIPRNLVQRSQGGTYVDLLRGSVKQQQPVEVGLENATEAEIVKGLSEGDLVIVR
jgi:RND family efflux transporter MFP subunit